MNLAAILSCLISADATCSSFGEKPSVQLPQLPQDEQIHAPYERLSIRTYKYYKVCRHCPRLPSIDGSVSGCPFLLPNMQSLSIFRQLDDTAEKIPQFGRVYRLFRPTDVIKRLQLCVILNTSKYNLPPVHTFAWSNCWKLCGSTSDVIPSIEQSKSIDE